MSFKIGDSVLFNNKTYTIVGTDKRSFILECDGRHYKATAAKLEKAKIYNTQSNFQYPNLEQKVKYQQIFNKQAKIPTNETECIPFFENLTGELSPENLSCDGELSSGQVREKLARIKATWKELEQICGRSVSEEEIEQNMMKRILAKEA